MPAISAVYPLWRAAGPRRPSPSQSPECPPRTSSPAGARRSAWSALVSRPVSPAVDYALSPAVEVAAIVITLSHLDTRYGGVASFLRAIGVRDEQISAARRRMR